MQSSQQEHLAKQLAKTQEQCHTWAVADWAEMGAGSSLQAQAQAAAIKSQRAEALDKLGGQ